MISFVKRIGSIGAVMAACGLLAACGGGGSSSPAVTTAADNSAAIAAAAAKEADAGRLAKQATFGATQTVVDRIISVGVSGWLDEQFAATDSSYTDLVTPVVTGSCGSDNVCFRKNFSREQVAMRFYQDALGKPDQLRQRVALALSELLVASTLEVPNAAGLASYNQLFLDNAFGNYRNILAAVTLHPFMGDYLDMADSNKTAPSENYARELLQLFSMGPDQLNMDGTQVKDSTGATVATYTPDDIKGVARALTGWTYARLENAAITDNLRRNYTVPMIQVAARYDTAAKTFLGTTVAANASQQASVDAVVDAAFNNSSTAPFVAHFLIQSLVTANPTPAYVGRVAAVFANNGSNVRGDMKAVIRAILTDSEARAANPTNDNAGKVKEPVLLLTATARAVGMTTDGYVFTVRDAAIGEPVLQAPSVFNFYPPDYPLPQSATLVSPASKLLTTGNFILRHNLTYDWTIGSTGTARSEFAANSTVTNSTGTTIDWSAWEAFGTDTDGMIARLNRILLNNTMTDAQKTALRNAANAITDATPSLQARKRAAVMLYAVLSSPIFQVDR